MKFTWIVLVGLSLSPRLFAEMVELEDMSAYSIENLERSDEDSQFSDPDYFKVEPISNGLKIPSAVGGIQDPVPKVSEKIENGFIMNIPANNLGLGTPIR